MGDWYKVTHVMFGLSPFLSENPPSSAMHASFISFSTQTRLTWNLSDEEQRGDTSVYHRRAEGFPTGGPKHVWASDLLPDSRWLTSLSQLRLHLFPLIAERIEPAAV